jgi:hypothetical protein
VVVDAARVACGVEVDGAGVVATAGWGVVVVVVVVCSGRGGVQPATRTVTPKAIGIRILTITNSPKKLFKRDLYQNINGWHFALSMNFATFAIRRRPEGSHSNH